jgi:Bacterial Ig domain
MRRATTAVFVVSCLAAGLLLASFATVQTDSAAALNTSLRHRPVRHPSNATPPVASPDSYNTPQSTPLSVPAPGVLANDTLNGATIASYGASTGTEQTSIGASTATTQGGTVTLNADGGFSYNPTSGFAGFDTFKYVLVNSAGSSTATVTLTVTASSPIASPDFYNTSQGTPLSVPAPGVLANDVLNGAMIASYGASTGSEQNSIGAGTPTAQGGTITLNADGSFNYNPVANFIGNDSFKYVLRNTGGSSTAMVTIAVQPPPGPYVVTSPGFFYAISGLSGQNPVLTLKRGMTYTFQINASSIHPFEILNAPPGSVTNNNISSGTLTFRVPTTAQDYAYVCSIHGFGNTIQTVP